LEGSIDFPLNETTTSRFHADRILQSLITIYGGRELEGSIDLPLMPCMVPQVVVTHFWSTHFVENHKLIVLLLYIFPNLNWTIASIVFTLTRQLMFQTSLCLTIFMISLLGITLVNLATFSLHRLFNANFGHWTHVSFRCRWSPSIIED